MQIKGDLRVELNPSFQTEIFSKLLKKYNPLELSRKLCISQSMLYHYRNNRVKNVSKDMMDEIKEMLNLNQSVVDYNTVKVFSMEAAINKMLSEGREKRMKQLIKFKESIPKVTELIEGNSINVEKWFLYYKRLIDFGTRKFIKQEVKDNQLVLEYDCISKGKMKRFLTKLPRKILLDNEFIYFFGLWVGDKSSGGRIGVINKNEKINKITRHFLIKLYQKPLVVLYAQRKLPKIKHIKIDKVVKIKSDRNGYAVSVHAINSMLKRFFDYLDKNLDNFLDQIPNKSVFFAGLFDAEGNVLLEDGSFRWSCKNKRRVKIFKKYLSSLNLFKRYDGANLVTNNKEVFRVDILPFIKHPQKINDVSLVCYGKGRLNKRFKVILKAIRDNPGRTQKELAKLLKRKKRYSQITFLERLGYVSRKGYPKRSYITNKGLDEVVDREVQGGKDYDHKHPLLVAAGNQ